MTRGGWSCCESLQCLEPARCEENWLLGLSAHRDQLAAQGHILEIARGAPGTKVDLLVGAVLTLTHQEVPQLILLLCHCPLCI